MQVERKNKKTLSKMESTNWGNVISLVRNNVVNNGEYQLRQHAFPSQKQQQFENTLPKHFVKNGEYQLRQRDFPSQKQLCQK